MATITKGKTFSDGDLVTPASIHQLVDAATISGIVNADISASAAIVDTKLAQISTANKVAQSAVTNLTTDLAGKAPTSHTHTIANVTGLQTALDGKQASGSYAPATGIAPSDITGTAVVTTDARLSDARTPETHTHSASDITSGNFANARTTATNVNTASAIVARDAYGDFVATRITSSQTIPKAGSLRFNDSFGTEVEILGSSIDDKLFIKAGGATILEIDNTNGFPLWKINTDGVASAFRVAIGTSTTEASAKLQVHSTTQGFLPPKMTQNQRDAITSPVSGLMIYNTSSDKLQVRTLTLWADLH